MINRARAGELLAAAQGKRVLIVGDVMLDRYIMGSVSRISPEAPVPVVYVLNENAVPGGAANVALNIQSLGGQALMAGLVGDDAAAGELKGLLSRQGIATDGLLECPGLRTTVKTRVIAERQQVVRFDHEGTFEQVTSRTGRLRQPLAALVATADGVIVEDYGKGVVQDDVVRQVMLLARDKGIPVGYDPKDDHPVAISGLAVATPNFKEACVAAGESPHEPLVDPLTDPRLARAAAVLLEKWTPALLAITLGPHGMYLCSANTAPILLPTRAREVFDVSGAGDTVIAATLLALVAGADRVEAAGLANYAAGVVCAKVGTAPCHAAELLDVLERE
jgi:D-beta-D-heptose 7-phosphate kinase/D-beta-D-heptose 1-phosphate adenosyltransferase